MSVINDNYLTNKKSIKHYVKNYLENIKSEIKNKIILDVPAGNGVTTELLLNYGAKVEAYDLFPEYFMLNDIKCVRADISKKIPVNDGYADMLICQEGIEHFSDQLKTLKEFNRTLKVGAELIVTTPSYSNLAAKLSYLLFESETNRQMPPNEIDDIWMSDKSISQEIYHGHIFLLGIQKLRILGKLAGFNIKEVKYVRLSKGSLILFPIFYPFIFVSSYWRYFRNLNKNKAIPKAFKQHVYKEQLMLNINPKHLINKHLFVVYTKDKNHLDVDFRIDSKVKTFEKVM